jgi:triosephosphate isomerase
MSRRSLIAGNWKMVGLKADGVALADDLADRMKAATDRSFDLLLCPPFTLIGAVGGAIFGSGIELGGQDCHLAEKGAHTGDISAQMLKDQSCGYVIVGHSERRTDHGETDAMVKAKAQAALQAGLTALICIGETEAEQNAGQTLPVVRSQIGGSLPIAATATNTVIAYEPVWAIGTGQTPTSDEVQTVHAAIRAALGAPLGTTEASQIRILYGGSVKPENAKELLNLADVDGGLVGSASLIAADFWDIAEACS